MANVDSGKTELAKILRRHFDDDGYGYNDALRDIRALFASDKELAAWVLQLAEGIEADGDNDG
jgi:hypothetical protein